MNQRKGTNNMLTFFVNYPGNFRFIWFWTKLTLKPWWHMFFLIWKTSKLSNCSWNVIIILIAHHPPPGHINSTGFLSFYILYKREELYKKRKVKVFEFIFSELWSGHLKFPIACAHLGTRHHARKRAVALMVHEVHNLHIYKTFYWIL